MIRFFALIARAEGVSSQEFHDHWRHPHGTMGNRIANMRSYVQGHQIHTDLLGQDQASYEGIAITGFDNIQEALAFGNEPQYVEHVQPDEPNFVDQSRLLWLYTTEEVLVGRAKPQDGADYADTLWNDLDHGTSIQLLQFIRPGNPDWAGEDDAELGRRIGALRHARNPAASEAGDANPDLIGARQLWWPTLTAFQQGVAKDPDAVKQLLAQGGDAHTALVRSERFLR
ncbi:EthD domain-containing protein [Streptomyces asoensis]|uniref:EthD domain-containing protein n=1 Tax=Streptomyces asoensis TaxID=249586 RepID=A0A6M4X3Y1_9ACTN|nr:EthD domain-containing protein [Streptomyces asoensis]QJT06365.1 EthD domain-containing protein [Streptomyces asoensis]